MTTQNLLDTLKNRPLNNVEIGKVQGGFSMLHAMYYRREVTYDGQLWTLVR